MLTKDGDQQLIQDRAENLCDNTHFALTLLENLVGYAIIAADFDGNILAYNEGARRTYGYAPEEVIGKRNIDILFPQEFIRGGKLQQIIDGLLSEERFSYEGEKVRRGGRRFPAQILFTLTKDRSGKAVSFVEMVEDLSERKLAEEMLRASRERLENIVNRSADGFLVIDSKGLVRFVNPAAEALFGHKAEELLGERFGLPVAEETTEIEIYHKGGEQGTAEMRVVQTYWDGEVCSLASLHDVTEYRRAQQKLKEYSEELEEMVEQRTEELKEAQEELVRKEKLATLGQLAGGVGHELRNPLGVMSNAVYFLKATLPEADATTKEYLDIIAAEVRTADKIIGDLLGFSRTRPAEREETTVSDLVEQALQRQPVPEGVEVRTEVSAELAPVRVDPGQIGQVLVNLVSNACQAMPQGGTLTIGAEPSKGGPTRSQQSGIQIQVADTGCGMSKETLKKVFEPLFTTRARGIGLGLAVSKNLVENNGGSIEAQSQEGKGSTFTIVLPSNGEAT